MLLQLLVGVYGGYFGAGMGIMMLAVFTRMGGTNIHRMNAVKTFLAAMINGASVVVFIRDGLVSPTPVVPEYVIALEKAASYLPPDQLALLRRAWAVGAAAHVGQMRKSGEPYITHPVAVADLLADLRLDAQTMTAAILHDVMEDTPNTKDEITVRFGRPSGYSGAIPGRVHKPPHGAGGSHRPGPSAGPSPATREASMTRASSPVS